MLINFINNLPTELIYIILEYQGYHTYRNGIYIKKIKIDDPIFKKLYCLPKISKIYRNVGYEINFIKKIIPDHIYCKINEQFNNLKCNICNQFHYINNKECENSICISKFMRDSLDNITDIVDLFINIKYNIKTIIFNEKVIWSMTTYILTPKVYSHSGSIHWEETEKNRILFITHMND